MNFSENPQLDKSNWSYHITTLESLVSTDLEQSLLTFGLASVSTESTQPTLLRLHLRYSSPLSVVTSPAFPPTLARGGGGIVHPTRARAGSICPARTPAYPIIPSTVVTSFSLCSSLHPRTAHTAETRGDHAVITCFSLFPNVNIEFFGLEISRVGSFCPPRGSVSAIILCTFNGCDMPSFFQPLMHTAKRRERSCSDRFFITVSKCYHQTLSGLKFP